MDKDYQMIITSLEKLEEKLDSNHEKVMVKFDNFKDEVCTPSRIKFEKKIAKVEVKQGIIGSIFGLAGGIIAKLIIK